MKKSLTILIAAVVVVAAFTFTSGCNCPIGVNGSNEPTSSVDKADVLKTATDFTVLNMDGKEVKLSDYFGKPIVVNFWATWCGPCKIELPDFNSAYEKYADEVVFLMVNLTDGINETIDGVKAFVENGGYSFPIYFDTQNSASVAYSISAIPTTVLINSDGSVYKTHTGIMNEATLSTHIEAMRNIK